MAVRSLAANVAESPLDWMTIEERSAAFKSAQNEPKALTLVIVDPTASANLYFENKEVF